MSLKGEGVSQFLTGESQQRKRTRDDEILPTKRLSAD